MDENPGDIKVMDEGVPTIYCPICKFKIVVPPLGSWKKLQPERKKIKCEVCGLEGTCWKRKETRNKSEPRRFSYYFKFPNLAGQWGKWIYKNDKKVDSSEPSS